MGDMRVSEGRSRGMVGHLESGVPSSLLSSLLVETMDSFVAKEDSLSARGDSFEVRMDDLIVRMDNLVVMMDNLVVRMDGHIVELEIVEDNEDHPHHGLCVAVLDHS